MIVTYYADVIFLWNFVTDFILLILIHPNTKKRYWRLAVAAIIGSASVLILLAIFVPAHLLFFALRFFVATVMVVIAVPARGIGEVLCNTALLYGASGCLFGISVLVSGMTVYLKERNMLLMIVSLGLVFAGKMLYYFRKKQCQRLVYQYVVRMKNGQNQMEGKAFFDSGNHLYEPISGKPVILIRNRVAKQLGVNPEKMRVVPYSSLGKKSGMLEAYLIDELIVQDEKDRYLMKQVYAAVAEETLFMQEACDVILHAELIKKDMSREVDGKHATIKHRMKGNELCY